MQGKGKQDLAGTNEGSVAAKAFRRINGGNCKFFERRRIDATSQMYGNLLLALVLRSKNSWGRFRWDDPDRRVGEMIGTRWWCKARHQITSYQAHRRQRKEIKRCRSVRRRHAGGAYMTPSWARSAANDQQGTELQRTRRGAPASEKRGVIPNSAGIHRSALPKPPRWTCRLRPKGRKIPTAKSRVWEQQGSSLRGKQERVSEPFDPSLTLSSLPQLAVAPECGLSGCDREKFGVRCPRVSSFRHEDHREGPANVQSFGASGAERGREPEPLTTKHATLLHNGQLPMQTLPARNLKADQIALVRWSFVCFGL